MPKPDEETKKKIRQALFANPSLSVEFIADEYNISKIIAAAFKRGMRKRVMIDNIDINTRKKIRDEYKSGNSIIKNISEKYNISEYEAELIEKEVYPNSSKVSTTLNKIKTSDDYKKYTNNFDIEDFIEILMKTAFTITNKNNRTGFLLYRQIDSKISIREIEAQHIMSNILSEYGYYHIIENPTLDFMGKGWTDLSICNKTGLRAVDIEFKINESDIKSDFYKFFRSYAFGAVSFFISVDSDLANVSKWYENAYREKLRKINFDLFNDKWFLLFYVSVKEKIAYVKFFESLKNIKKGCLRRISKCKVKTLTS